MTCIDRCVVCIVGEVCGVTQLDNVLYAVCDDSSIIKKYTSDTLSPLAEDIHVEGMKRPSDIVVCQQDRQLYVADWNCTIWRVSIDDQSYILWLRTRISIRSLSMTSRRLLVTSYHPPTVRQYNTTNKQQLCDVKLPQYVEYVEHAFETTHGTFVVCHQGTSQDKEQRAVSELLRFCDAYRVTYKQTEE